MICAVLLYIVLAIIKLWHTCTFFEYNHGDQIYYVWSWKLTMVWSISCLLGFNTKWCCNLSLWQAIHCFLSSLWSCITSCTILELTVWSLSCLQVFSTKHCYGLNLCPLTLRTNRVLPLMMVIKYTKLYDPGDYGSVSILPTRFFYLVMIRLTFDLWPWKTIRFLLSWWWSSI
jgi:hypothetical protein